MSGVDEYYARWWCDARSAKLQVLNAMRDMAMNSVTEAILRHAIKANPSRDCGSGGLEYAGSRDARDSRGKGKLPPTLYLGLKTGTQPE